MPSKHSAPRAALLLLAATAALASCGGGSAPAAVAPVSVPGPPPAAAPTTLSASVSALALKASGQARTISVTNTGAAPALNPTLTPSGLPVGTDLSDSTCGAQLAPGDSCSFTFTPGLTPTALPGVQNPPTALLDIRGDNTNTVSVVLSVIHYGSVYQGGYVFAIDDGTDASRSMGGKVVALTTAPGPLPWSPGIDVIDGIYEVSTTPCEGAVDGACNTRVLVDRYGEGPYAAWACHDSTDSGFTDWYLPAICELGYGGTGADPCGTRDAPRLIDTLQARLAEGANIGGLVNSSEPFRSMLLSSTNSSVPDLLRPNGLAYAYGFSGDAPMTLLQEKTSPQARTRCVRALTQP